MVGNLMANAGNLCNLDSFDGVLKAFWQVTLVVSCFGDSVITLEVWKRAFL